jgi:hypothetical protein
MSFLAGFSILQQDKNFETLHKSTKIRQLNTHPATMARDSKSHTSKARRTSTSSIVSSTTATRSRFSAAADPTPPHPGPGQGTYATSEAGGSNVTGFRTRLDVAGSPQSDYFISGASKRDRRAEYIGRPLTGSCFVVDHPQPVRSPSEYSAREQEQDAIDEDDGSEDDSATILPSDSVSQVGRGRGRGRTRAKPRALFGEVNRGGGAAPLPMPMGAGGRVGLQRSQTYPEVGSGMVGGHQQSFGGGRRYSVVETKPQVR